MVGEWRSAHRARHLDDIRDSDAELDLDRGDVERVAHARLQLACPVVMAVIVLRLPHGVAVGD